ncbi:MAG: cytidine deaminase [Bacteroidaceae bacterium]|nr:cytidine deaminase [Bacteroidaceae bacterium]MBR0432887.1 cytidine deaminase [Bacteroidaceae bacterium]
MKSIEIKVQIQVFDVEELSDSDRHLVERAKEMTQTSYSPYSEFRVGAAIRLQDGQVFAGSNQENAAYPVGSCAERTTFFYAQANAPEVAPEAIAIAAFTNGHFLEKPISPCGMCRQALLEAETRYGTHIRVLLYGTDGVYVAQSMRDLLPLTFDGSEMA